MSSLSSDRKNSVLQFKGANIRYVNLHDNYKNNNNNNNNRTLDTLVGGEHSHRCTIPAPHIKTLASIWRFTSINNAFLIWCYRNASFECQKMIQPLCILFIQCGCFLFLFSSFFTNRPFVLLFTSVMANQPWRYSISVHMYGDS